MSAKEARAELRRKEREAILAAYGNYESPNSVTTDEGRTMSLDQFLRDSPILDEEDEEDDE